MAIANGGGGASSLTVEAITSRDPPFLVDTSRTRFTVKPGEVSWFDVTFSPAAVGALCGTIEVTVAGKGLLATLYVQGRGLP